jgi:catechol-2,3-dioxygenase
MADGAPIDPRVDIGHVHLKVADLDRALDFYCGVLCTRATEDAEMRSATRAKAKPLARSLSAA